MVGNIRQVRDLRKCRQGWSSWVALFAAYALVLQALLGALAIGASASPQFDAFGNVICTSHGAETLPGGGAPSKRNHLPDCCLVGCSMFSPIVMPAPDTASMLAPAVREADAIVQTRAEHPVSGREGSPGNPRAPPLTA